MGKTPSKSQAKTPETKKIKFNRRTVCFAIFVTAWAALAMIASQFVIGYPMIWLLHSDFEKPLWTLVYYVLNYLLALTLIIFVTPRLWQVLCKTHPKLQAKPAKVETDKNQNPFATTPSELGFGAAPTFVDMGLAPVGYVVYIFSALVLTNFMNAFSWFNAEQPQDVGFNYLFSTSDRIFAMLAIVFVAPIAEEIIMRGWLYGKLRSKLNVVISMLIVSVLFGVLHGQWNVAVGTFALSMILCGLREVTGTIWSGILLHMLVNGIAFYQLFVLGI